MGGGLPNPIFLDHLKKNNLVLVDGQVEEQRSISSWRLTFIIKY